jgi:uncharacterized RDD family membrane protein YckC
MTLYSENSLDKNAGVADARPPEDDNHRRPPGIAGRVIGAVVGPLVTPVIDQVDVDDVVSRIDIDQVLRRIDLDELLQRIDLDAVVDRIDLDQLIDKVDLNQILARIDIDQLLARMDVNAVVERVDIDAVIDRVDVNRVLERVDTDALIERTEIGSLITKSTSGMVLRMLDVIRSWVMTVDATFHALVDGLLLRRRRRAEGEAPPEPVSRSQARWARAEAWQGTPAGMISRLVAFLIDVATVQLLFALSQQVVTVIWETLTGHTWDISDHRVWSVTIFVVFVYLYFSLPLAASGRTFGKAVLGLKVERVGGAPLDPPHAFLRVLVMPLSFILFGLGLAIGVVRRDRRTLHDLIASTDEIYAWDARAGSLRSLAHDHMTPPAPAPAPPPAPSEPPQPSEPSVAA